MVPRFGFRSSVNARLRRDDVLPVWLYQWMLRLPLVVADVRTMVLERDARHDLGFARRLRCLESATGIENTLVIVHHL